MANDYLPAMLSESELDPVGMPDGVLFLQGEAILSLEKKTRAMAGLFEKSGYQRVIPPIFEYYETFEKGGGSDIARRSFSFKDKDGKLLSLRYDMTTPIARMTAMRCQEKDLPVKYYYCEDVFREQPLHKGKMRQLKQAGIEYIGSKDISCDAGILTTLGEALSLLSKDFTIAVGDIRLYKILIDRIEASETDIHALHGALNRKDKVSLKIILDKVSGDPEAKKALMALPDMAGNAESVRESLGNLFPDGLKIIEKLFDIVQTVPENIREKLVLDLGLIKDFKYYSSLTIEGFIDGVGHSIANGGRYDNLFREFGRDFPAVGFAVNLNA